MKIIADIQKQEKAQPTTPPPPEKTEAVFFRWVKQCSAIKSLLLVTNLLLTLVSFLSRGEHLAVRNAEGSFYLCQALQQIYKSSKKIRIQWMSLKATENSNKDLFIPEYYDKTGIFQTYNRQLLSENFMASYQIFRQSHVVLRKSKFYRRSKKRFGQ